MLLFNHILKIVYFWKSLAYQILMKCLANIYYDAYHSIQVLHRCFFAIFCAIIGISHRNYPIRDQPRWLRCFRMISNRLKGIRIYRSKLSTSFEPSDNRKQHSETSRVNESSLMYRNLINTVRKRLDNAFSIPISSLCPIASWFYEKPTYPQHIRRSAAETISSFSNIKVMSSLYSLEPLDPIIEPTQRFHPPTWISKTPNTESSCLPSGSGDVFSSGVPSSNIDSNKVFLGDHNKNIVYPSRYPIRFTTKSIRQKILVLDLDDTLFYASFSTAGMLTPPTFFEVIPSVTGAQLLHVWVRPYINIFLETVSRLYNLVVFTAASPVYADSVLNRIDPKKLIKRRYYRAHCTQVPANTLTRNSFNLKRFEDLASSNVMLLVKDIASVLRVPMELVVVLEDREGCAIKNPENTLVVPIYRPPGYHTTKDPETKTQNVIDDDDVLLAVLPLLEALLYVPDVRLILNRHSSIPSKITFSRY